MIILTQPAGPGDVTQYNYDPLDRLATVTYADGTGYSYSNYDVHDNSGTLADANGTVVTCTYDLNNRLTGKSIAPGAGVSGDTTAEAFKYDGLSRLVRAEDNDSIVERSYDSLGDIVKETLTIDKGLPTVITQPISATHDQAGNTLTVTRPSGAPTTLQWYRYDSLDRKFHVGTNPTADYWYIGRQRVALRRYPFANQTRVTFGYDPAGRVTGMKRERFDLTVLDDRTYAWDEMGNKVQRADVRTGGPPVLGAPRHWGHLGRKRGLPGNGNAWEGPFRGDQR